MNIKSIGIVIFSLLLSMPPLAMATIQQHTFTITGDTGETGTGSFTWDDATVPDGSVLNDHPLNMSPNVLSIHIEISGGSITGAPIVFDTPDCGGAVLKNTPNFSEDVGFWCSNGPYQLEVADPFYAFVQGGPSAIGVTFSQGVTVAVPISSAVPTMSVYGLVLTMLGVLLVVTRRLSSKPMKAG